mgnify:CR=1 FL=1
MTQMIVPAFRFSANPALRLGRLRCLARPAGQGLLLVALLLFLATVVTGAYWLAERFYFLPQRRRAAQALLDADTQRRAELDRMGIQKVDVDVHEAKGRILMQPWWLDWTAGLFPVLFVVFVLRSFLFEPFKIPSGSMIPTLLVGDLILVNKFTYGVRLPVINTKITQGNPVQRGDVMVFRYPPQPTLDYIKRVVGLPGDRIIYRNKQLFIQPACAGSQDCPAIAKVEQTFLSSGDFIQGGVPLERYQEQLGNVSHRILKNPQQPDYVPMYFHQPGNEADEWVVPEGHYFAMGDNRDNSKDSRFWGFVPERNLVGKAVFIWISFEFERDPGSPIPGWIPTGVRFNRIGGIQ